MRQRLRASGSNVSRRTALTLLRQIQQRHVGINSTPVTGVSRIHPEQRDIFRALKLGGPTRKAAV